MAVFVEPCSKDVLYILQSCEVRERACFLINRLFPRLAKNRTGEEKEARMLGGHINAACEFSTYGPVPDEKVESLKRTLKALELGIGMFCVAAPSASEVVHTHFAHTFYIPDGNISLALCVKVYYDVEEDELQGFIEEFVHGPLKTKITRLFGIEPETPRYFVCSPRGELDVVAKNWANVRLRERAGLN